VKSQGQHPQFVFSSFELSSTHIVIQLLVRDPSKRLQDPTEIKQHPFFKGIDWEKLYNKQITPPYKPPVVRSHTHTHTHTLSLNHFKVN
jgi:hypothetical protein